MLNANQPRQLAPRSLVRYVLDVLVAENPAERHVVQAALDVVGLVPISGCSCKVHVSIGDRRGIRYSNAAAVLLTGEILCWESDSTSPCVDPGSSTSLAGVSGIL
jgi:hypothetical protein